MECAYTDAAAPYPYLPGTASGESFVSVSEQDRVQALLHAVVALSIERDPDVIARTIVDTAMRLVGASLGALGVAGPDGRLVRVVTATAGDGAGSGSAASQTRDRRRIRRALTRLIDGGLPPAGPVGFLGLPIDTDGRTWGGLYVEGKRHGPFDDFDWSTLKLLMAVVRPAVENARLALGRRPVTRRKVAS